MGDLGRGIGKAVGKVASAIGLTDIIRRDKPRKPVGPSLPDESQLELEAKRKRSRLALRGGRASTILDDDETLG